MYVCLVVYARHLPVLQGGQHIVLAVGAIQLLVNIALKKSTVSNAWYFGKLWIILYVH